MAGLPDSARFSLRRRTESTPTHRPGGAAGSIAARAGKYARWWKICHGPCVECRVHGRLAQVVPGFMQSGGWLLGRKRQADRAMDRPGAALAAYSTRKAGVVGPALRIERAQRRILL